jgi:hypothetical protein
LDSSLNKLEEDTYFEVVHLWIFTHDSYLTIKEKLDLTTKELTKYIELFLELRMKYKNCTEYMEKFRKSSK